MNLDQVRENARKASTESLLDRVTVFRSEMERPESEFRHYFPSRQKLSERWRRFWD